MTSETREIAHDQHTHPGVRFYLVIGAILIFFTVLEVVGYVGEVNHWYGAGTASFIILTLSALKFVSVVAYYMHLKYDHKLFTGVFVFPAILGTLVIGGMILLFGPLHGTATAVDHGVREAPGPGVEAAAPAPAAH